MCTGSVGALSRTAGATLSQVSTDSPASYVKTKPAPTSAPKMPVKGSSAISPTRSSSSSKAAGVSTSGLGLMGSATTGVSGKKLLGEG